GCELRQREERVAVQAEIGRREPGGRGVDLLLARVEQRMELEPAARRQGGQMAGQRSGSQTDDADLDHGSSGTAFSTTSISSNRIPPGERRNATSRVPKP